MLETIVALATAPMKSALAVIRVSGDESFSVVSKCFSKDLVNITKRTALVGEIINDKEIIDQVVVIAYKGPKSFTGEDLVEIICHGSTLIANEIIELLISKGAKHADRGEFSMRAFLNQKIDLVQAEAINDVINATTKEAKKISIFSLEGDVSKLIYPVKVMIADLISLIEVNIDYPEYEDIEVANKEKIISDIDKINIVLKELTTQGEKAKIIKDGLKVGIFGKPNVGKSSLLNALLGEEKAIVTDIAGTTRDVVEGDIVLKGLTLHLLDTAGIRESDDVVENIGVNKAKAIIDEAELVIVVLDASKELDKQDKDILELTKDKKRIIVYNKKDLAISIPDNSVAISAKENDIDALVKAIYDAVGIDEVVFNQPSLNNARQIGLLKQAMEHLNTAKADAENDLGVDLISVSLFSAYKSVLAILGEDNEIDISKEIFSRFCVGK
ncbi:MAG: tRNA uridine-5-carboxymethylaminomethyl(34) synthesis GTPase MnmE [Bacilli bacterium]|nr:tRNA uridine-5-carboxymethylaminomethyl(34) synthesis GTPase MnmE [Bacilli bacterium]